MFLFLQIDSLLNFLTQSIWSMWTILKYDNTIACANIVAIMKNVIVSSRIDYAYMASSQSKFALLNLPITVNFSKSVFLM